MTLINRISTLTKKGIDMFERFTDRARKVMALANQEAQRLNHEYIGTEHILLGILKEGQGAGATALKNLDIDLLKARTGLEKRIKQGSDTVTMGRLPQTPQTTSREIPEKILKYAQKVSKSRPISTRRVGAPEEKKQRSVKCREFKLERETARKITEFLADKEFVSQAVINKEEKIFIFSKDKDS